MAKPQNSWSSVPPSVRNRLRQLVLERDGYRCRIRGPKCTRVATELDHIVPRKDGGAVLDPNNCRASCEPCNRGRRDPSPGRSAPADPSTVRPSRDW